VSATSQMFLLNDSYHVQRCLGSDCETVQSFTRYGTVFGPMSSLLDVLM